MVCFISFLRFGGRDMGNGGKGIRIHSWRLKGWISKKQA
jgi:hypothetical protein